MNRGDKTVVFSRRLIKKEMCEVIPYIEMGYLGTEKL